jgi:hypothetical protein
MANISVGTYTSDFRSDEDKYISKEQRCTNCNELEGNLKSALAELSFAQLIIRLLQKESHQGMIPKDTTDNTRECTYYFNDLLQDNRNENCYKEWSTISYKHHRTSSKFMNNNNFQSVQPISKGNPHPSSLFTFS